ncbi:hypothetical protein ACFWBB_30785 [Streptomyces sp. NPDC060000]|uniref:hypothetical protein n=1 Tax=Streptomyces sp. NPDC060000 TaxID=3347031 RepID=UPI0036B2BE24
MTPEILARIATARAARDLSDLARQFVATTAQPTNPTERIRKARELRELVNQLVDLTVLAEAFGGAPWEDVTAALGRQDPGTVKREFADDIAEWGGKSEEELERGAAGHEAIDEWYARHREDLDPEASTPVDDLLNRH